MVIDYNALCERYLALDASFSKRLNPAELKIDLLCRGVLVHPTCQISEEGRPLVHTRAGLGSGLEIILPGEHGDLWVNAPVVEKFVQRTPYNLLRTSEGYIVFDERHDFTYPVRLASKPLWYDRLTTRGVPMSRIATLQGTCFSVYLGARCRFWTMKEPLNCKFCTSGLNLGVEEEETKTVEDVVETALAAREESQVTFAHLNGGYQGVDALRKIFPYLEGLKRQSGLLVGLQFTPERDLTLYDRAIELGADHLSFCFEFYDPAYFTRYLPGKARLLGRASFFRAMEYGARKMGMGKVSGEIIAGVEPVEATLRAIEYIIGAGAFPMVCIFRPLVGAQMQDDPPPRYADMLRVFRHVYRTCRAHRFPIGIAPNVHVSLSLQPDDTLYLNQGKAEDYFYLAYLKLLKQVSRPHFAYKMRCR